MNSPSNSPKYDLISCGDHRYFFSTLLKWGDHIVIVTLAHPQHFLDDLPTIAKGDVWLTTYTAEDMFDIRCSRKLKQVDP